MKKIISILTVLFLCTQTIVSVFAGETELTPLPIEAEFTDANFLAAVREIIGKTNGEHIYKSDVESIKELDISNKEIKDLHGLEYFIGLESLICYFNDFSEMDLSHNTNLVYLDFSYNTDIKAVNLSHNLALETLICNYTNIESLNIINNINLKELICYSTLICKLSLENNTQLEMLDAWDMKLKNLDISKNTNLKHLDCGYNQLTKLDISNNPNLELLMCDHNCMDKNPQNAIIGYDAIVERLGEPTTFDYHNYPETGFVYYPQKDPYEITGLRLKDTNGAVIEKPQENKSFIVEADIIKNNERNEQDYLFVAVYDTESALIDLNYVKAKFIVDGECSFGFNIPAQGKTVGSVKAFVWNTFHSMEALAESKILNFTDNR